MSNKLTRMILLLVGATLLLAVVPAPSAQAHHRRGHHCRQNPHQHPRSFIIRKAEALDVARSEVRGEHRHHKHPCKARAFGLPPPPPPAQYPPRAERPDAAGAQIAFPVEQPARPPGLTVGPAALLVMGVLATLLVVRRRWAYRRT